MNKLVRNLKPAARAGSEKSEQELLALEAQYCSFGDTVHYSDPPKIFDRCVGSFIYDADGKEFLEIGRAHV